ncbi:CPBP family intramembrane glutamic endopeptidase [Clostridium sp.]|uniref:CPBP family intramembrane glutamic endopeptidase n=1 Tax=Clostridium sp. TaxID=1506 RepID=UPI00260B1596|nr:CPBP family intramembrane glutamic endopeptidase [Clostridium sp.]
MVDDLQQEIDNRRLALKQEIKITGGNCTRILLILAISTYAIGFGIVFGIKIMNIISGLIGSNNTIKLSKDTYGFFTGYFPCIIGDIIAIILAIKATKISFKKDIFTKIKSTKKFVFLGTVSCIGTGTISSLLYMIYSAILKSIGITIPQPDFSFPKQSVYLVLFLIYVCLLGPILEEIIFRGFILKSMRRYGNLTAIIVTSILFSMFHLNLVQFINPVLMGIVLAFIAIKSESIIPSIIAHIFNNTITFLMAAISLLKLPLIYNVVVFVYILFGAIVFALFIHYYIYDFIGIIKEDNMLLMTYEKVKYSFSGKWALAYVIFYVIFIIATMVLTNIMKIS